MKEFDLYLIRTIPYAMKSCHVRSRLLLSCNAARRLSRIILTSISSLQMFCAIIDEKVKPSSYLESAPYGLQKLLHDVLSSDLDVDRMDYLLRDSHMAGVKYGIYDPE